MRPLTEQMRKDGQPLSLKEYLSAQGYKACEKATTGLKPAQVIELIKEAGLLGRGGAGFSTGFKMAAVPPLRDDKNHYLVVNADEMEPGTFKDRWLLEGNPHQLIEGIIIAARAISARVAYIFLRGEYTQAQKVLEHALLEASCAGILDSGPQIHVHLSAGRYICGEETALLNALEGRRALPRTKPPFPQMSGLFGMPTVVQNVETICNLPHIISHGASWYKSLGKAIDSGTKIFGVSGKVKCPGAFELPIGTKGHDIIFNHAQGLLDGLKLRAFMPGGASTDLLPVEYLDVPMDYSSMAKMKTRMGTGTMIIIDDHTCPVGLLVNLERFFKQESCGFCTPCREGLPWVHDILLAIEEGDGREGDLEILRQHGRVLAPGSTFCALAPGASAPLLSGLTLFADDFLQHIAEKGCPYRR
jgi:NADH-quinone oxidoreductase subunit F